MGTDEPVTIISCSQYAGVAFSRCWVGSMRVFRVALVLLAVLVLGVSFALPAEDAPKSAQDESESQPYEMTPRLFSELVKESVLALPPVPFGDLHPALKYVVILGQLMLPDPGSLTILNHSLRC